jgi:hypothetical protein
MTARRGVTVNVRILGSRRRVKGAAISQWLGDRAKSTGRVIAEGDNQYVRLWLDDPCRSALLHKSGIRGRLIQRQLYVDSGLSLADQS